MKRPTSTRRILQNMQLLSCIPRPSTVYSGFQLKDHAIGVQVLERIKDPLMTLLSRDHFETAYAVLCHFHLIAQRAPVIFSQVSYAYTVMTLMALVHIGTLQRAFVVLVNCDSTCPCVFCALLGTLMALPF